MRQEDTNKVERLSLQFGYTTGNGVGPMEQNGGQLERRRRGNCKQLKCACCGGPDVGEIKMRPSEKYYR